MFIMLLNYHYISTNTKGIPFRKNGMIENVCIDTLSDIKKFLYL